MDPDYIPQDVARCDLCKTAIVQSYCDFCHVNLCKPCIGEHVSDNYKKQHIIVPSQERKSTLIYPKCNCETHEKEDCKYQCKDCNIYICSHCFASKQHNDHTFIKLAESFHKKKEDIIKDRKELREQILPVYEETVISLRNLTLSLEKE